MAIQRMRVQRKGHLQGLTTPLFPHGKQGFC
jgi:hypothetical protein